MTHNIEDLKRELAAMRQVAAEQQAEISRLERDRDSLSAQLSTARADELQAMRYLESVRQAAGHEGDFPSLIGVVRHMRAEAT